MGELIKFNACKYLDFDDHSQAEKVLASIEFQPVVCWDITKNYDDDLKLVQFCKKRGRLNCATMCVDEEQKQCALYEEFEHEIYLENLINDHDFKKGINYGGF